jgi:hypothetical protein
MKFLVTFEGGDGGYNRGVISNIYGVSNGLESGLIDRTQIGLVRPFMRFYGKGQNVDPKGYIIHDIFGADYVSKEYATLNDLLENEGRWHVIDHALRLRKPVHYKYND